MKRIKLISVQSRFRSNFYTGFLKLDWAKLKTAFCTILYITLFFCPDNISAVRDTNGITCYENALVSILREKNVLDLNHTNSVLKKKSMLVLFAILFHFSECKPGFYGINCSKTCLLPYYGEGCQQECVCSKDEECDISIGCQSKPIWYQRILI